MDIEARAAFITAMAANCHARVAAMSEQNHVDRLAGRPVTYTPDDIENAPNQFSLGHNDVVMFLTT